MMTVPVQGLHEGIEQLLQVLFISSRSSCGKRPVLQVLQGAAAQEPVGSDGGSPPVPRVCGTLRLRLDDYVDQAAVVEKRVDGLESPPPRRSSLMRAAS